MPNPTFVKFAGEMEAFSQEKIEHEEFFITDLKNVESEVTSSVFKLRKEIYIDLRNIERCSFFFLFIGFSSLTK
jgi:hypothetical protein